MKDLVVQEVRDSRASIAAEFGHNLPKYSTGKPIANHA